uniref:Uncharacterized protein n=1 Tax=Candidatus Kentrum sp. TUN TaxID=2126343 RepID=A0A450ZRK6_9GAMM|nr:MAG: hypothetical protein BECKTUN1418E_GA0071001_100316 [Candidatus Kentron sp. TUN]VFK51688.1 MAG: hypothetical protein BECKTUN1418F_GA0071002_100316 [Candidatus Kentron sp. TUN]VFK56459.1 MAG: hypothetical protein BECKTUN1418D_GA0071000_104713 [Candidatus Kentron sp. TUN]
MKPKLYLETSVVSYRSDQTSHDVIIARHQQSTCLLWQKPEDDFKPFVSTLVIVKDPIVEEIRRYRMEHTRRFDFDLHRIREDLRELEKGLEGRVVEPRPKRPEPKTGRDLSVTKAGINRWISELSPWL